MCPSSKPFLDFVRNTKILESFCSFPGFAQIAPIWACNNNLGLFKEQRKRKKVDSCNTMIPFFFHVLNSNLYGFSGAYLVCPLIFRSFAL